MSREITYWMFLRNRRAMMSVLSAVLAMIFMLFFESILTMHLINDMKLSENTAGYFFGLICANICNFFTFCRLSNNFHSKKMADIFSFFNCICSIIDVWAVSSIKFPKRDHINGRRSCPFRMLMFNHLCATAL